ncbi:MAG TPA: hypothetical protein VNR89_04025 [Roseomonas sp.]|nr:hypothetical protein [Roseomonas sp.]
MQKRRAPLVGLYAPAAQSGKTTLAKALGGFGWQTVKFAAPLKAMIRALLVEVGCPAGDIERYIEGDLKEAPNPYLGGATTRHAMQTLGTEWGRACMGSNFWVEMFRVKANKLRDMGVAVVTDDMRFPNEYDAIAEDDGITVHVSKPGVERAGGHSSEGALDNEVFSIKVVNDYPNAVQYALDVAPKVSSYAWTGSTRA